MIFQTYDYSWELLNPNEPYIGGNFVRDHGDLSKKDILICLKYWNNYSLLIQCMRKIEFFFNMIFI